MQRACQHCGKTFEVAARETYKVLCIRCFIDSKKSELVSLRNKIKQIETEDELLRNTTHTWGGRVPEHFEQKGITRPGITFRSCGNLKPSVSHTLKKAKRAALIAVQICLYKQAKLNKVQ